MKNKLKKTMTALCAALILMGGFSVPAYALIDKNENRGTDIRRVRPSIRAQLAADKRKAAPKKAAVKSKNHELEV